MTIRVTCENDVTVAVHGALNIRSVTETLEQVESMIRTGGQKVIDLSAVDHMDSAGLALLVDLKRRMQAGGERLTIKNIPAQILPIASLCGLDRMLSD